MAAARVLAERYEVGPTLGSGLQGKVKLGTDLESGKKVALKLVDASKMASRPKEKANLEREIEAMKRLDHENVLRLTDVKWDVKYTKKDGTPKRDVVLIVVDLAEGGELFDFMMHTGCFPEDIARTYFRQLIAGLEHCHKNAITHRDLKPENLLLSKEFKLLIADFGLSAITENEDGTPSLLRTECGTRGYMAPEVLAGTPYRGESADIWSCGVILFIMLAGFPPFQLAANPDWWFLRIRNGQYSLFWEAHQRTAMFSPKAMAFLNKIFVANPGDRATIAQIKEDPWFAEGSSDGGETLAAELTRRKTAVERQKRIEKEAEQRKKDAERARRAAAGGETFDAFAAPVYRSVGADDEDAKVEEGEPAPPLPEEHGHVARYTSFYTKKSPGAITSRLAQAFSEMCADHKADDAAYKVKATVTSPGGTVELRARVYKAPEEGLHLVDFTRRQGDMLRFQEVFKVLCENLSDVIEAPPASGAGEEDAAAAGGASGGGDDDGLI